MRPLMQCYLQAGCSLWYSNNSVETVLADISNM